MVDQQAPQTDLERRPGEKPEGIDLPDPIAVTFRGPAVLACGSEIKNTFCVVSDGRAYVSWDTGNLAEYENYDFFVKSVKDMCGMLEAEPGIVAHDLHPDYLSTRYAQSVGADRLEAVQHHHAHVAAAMAEHGLAGPVLGVALDGMGLGDDGTMWGGEFLVADLVDYRRVGHFKPYPLPGGDQATRNPARMALSCLVTEVGDMEVIHRLLPGLDDEEADVLRRMVLRGVRCPLTSSAGRLFDAVSALLGLCMSISYEAEAAILLQQAAERSDTDKSYPFVLEDGMLDFGPMIRVLVEEREADGDISAMARKFHNTLAIAVTAACHAFRKQRGVRQVVLVGGVFQNRLLRELIVDGLQADNFEVYTPRRLPPTDAALSLGQAVIAAARAADNG